MWLRSVYVCEGRGELESATSHWDLKAFRKKITKPSVNAPYTQALWIKITKFSRKCFASILIYLGLTRHHSNWKHDKLRTYEENSTNILETTNPMEGVSVDLDEDIGHIQNYEAPVNSTISTHWSKKHYKALEQLKCQTAMQW